MKTIGIIAEYNPFHKGHEYQINQIRKIHPESRIIVVMSGDYVQRGEPAIIDKWSRAQMALLGGADMVIELPVIYATAASKDFAYAGVSLLNSLGVVDELAFGCEDNDIEKYNEIADFLITPPSQYDNTLLENINNGMSYPKARENALCQYIDNSKDIISKPNNILALEYIIAIKQLKSSIVPLPILRNGSDYNDTCIKDETMCSAMAIRNSIRRFPQAVESQMPPYAYSIIKNCELKDTDSFCKELRYKLLSEHDFTKYYDISEDLSNIINKYKMDFENISDLIDTLKSKNLTYSHISRCLIHILLNIKVSDMANKKPQYARILGLNKSNSIFSDIKDNSSIPLISKLADVDKNMPSETLQCLEKDIFASELYSGINEYRRQIIVL